MQEEQPQKPTKTSKVLLRLDPEQGSLLLTSFLPLILILSHTHFKRFSVSHHTITRQIDHQTKYSKSCTKQWLPTCSFSTHTSLTICSFLLFLVQVLARVQNFLPQLKEANLKLDENLKGPDALKFDLETPDEKADSYIEMVGQFTSTFFFFFLFLSIFSQNSQTKNLSLGVFDVIPQLNETNLKLRPDADLSAIKLLESDSSSEDSSSSDSDDSSSEGEENEEEKEQEGDMDK
jgi:hypothetical protein